MHGLIFSELRKYADARLGVGGWESLLKRAGLGARIYLTVGEYVDAEVVALVTSASEMTGLTSARILEDFGEFMVPDLIGMYSSLLDPSWKTLDVVEHTERSIHRVVRLKNAGARPPALVCKRQNESQLILRYTSHRKMCGIAKGIVLGLARHFEENVFIEETSCMLLGAPACEVYVTLRAVTRGLTLPRLGSRAASAARGDGTG